MVEITPLDKRSSIAALLASRDLSRLGVEEVPERWCLSSVGDACEIRNDLRHPISVEDRATMQGAFPYYGPTGVLDYLNEYRAEGEFALIGEDGDHFLDPLNKQQTVRISGRFNVNNHAHLVSGTDQCDVDWFSYFFLHRDIFHSLTRQGANRFKLTKAALSKLPILLPPLPEQCRIAEILRTWDEAIEKLETVRSTKSKKRLGVVNSIFGLAEGSGTNWPKQPLSAISTRIKRTTDGGDHPVMTISAKSGFLLQSDKFARNMAGKSVDRYTMLKKGEFAYNKGNSKTAPYGCIFRMEENAALIPFVYYCFRLDDQLHHPFYEHLFAAGALNYQLSRLINSGVRNDGLLNLYADDFFGCFVPVPPIGEQKRIATAITAMNTELDLIDTEIDALQRQKRGLMQKLLTGEWRVTLDGKTEAA